MKNTKRWIAMLLALCLMLGMAACSTTNGDTPAEIPAASENGNASTDNNTGSDNTGSDNAATGEVTTYHILGQQGAATGDWNGYWLFRRISEDVGVKFDVTMVSIEGLQEKKNLGLATGEYPDFYFAGILTEDDIANYGAQGIFLPLEDYINEENTPNMVKAFEKYPDLKASLYYPDGHIYNLTGMNADPVSANRFHAWIDVDWAEKLNVPVPTTLDEFHDYLLAVKNGDPNGNGEQDEIPFGGRYNTEYFRNLTPILTAFGFTENGMEAVDGKVQYNPAQPLYKEFLAYMNMLWEEGLIDQEYFTQSEEQYFAKQVNNLYGTFADYAHWVRMYNSEEVWGQYDAWDPMTSDYNDKQIWPAYSVSPLGAFVVTDKCKNVEEVMRIADWFYDTEHSDWSIQGVPLGMWEEDATVGWSTKDVEGGREIEHAWPAEYDDYQTFSHQRCTADYGTFPNIPSTDLVSTGPQFVLEEATRQHRVPFYHVGWPTLKYTAEEADEIALIKVDIDDYYNQMFAKFVTGEESLDNFDAFVQGLKDRNLDRLVELQQQAYDRWASSK